MRGHTWQSLASHEKGEEIRIYFLFRAGIHATLGSTPQRHVNQAWQCMTLTLTLGSWTQDQGHPWLHRELEASLGYMEPLSKTTTKSSQRASDRLLMMAAAPSFYSQVLEKCGGFSLALCLS